MSCGRNRRRPALHSRSHQSSVVNSSRSKKTDRSENSSKQVLRKTNDEVDRFRIFDDSGDDVTPRRITDYVRVDLPRRSDEEKSGAEPMKKQLMENQERSVSEKSFASIANLTTSASRLAQTETLFSTGGKATLDIGTRIILESEHLLGKTHTERQSRTDATNPMMQATFLPGLGLQPLEISKDSIVLTETSTSFIVNLNSTVVSRDDADVYNTITEKNNSYLELCRNKRGNDRYIERGMQTFHDLSKHEHTITDALWTRSQHSWANAWDIHDSLSEAERHEGKIFRQHTAQNRDSLVGGTAMLDERTMSDGKKTIVSTVSSQNSSTLFSQESLVRMNPSKMKCFQFDASDTNQKLPDIDVEAFVMERILNLNVYYQKQAVFQGFRMTPEVNGDDPETKHFDNRKNDTFASNATLTLERLWHYASVLTRSRNVSCLCWNERRHNLLAVGYGQFQYNDEKEGLVCCWNAKNLEFPERYFQTDAGVTSLAFSLRHPNFLAVGLFNGAVCIFDLNQNNTAAIVHTNEYAEKHTGPVWQIAWHERGHSSEMENGEVLISISSDGRIVQWVLRKEFEAMDLMRLKPYMSAQRPCRAAENGNGSGTNARFAHFAGGLCFDIRSSDKTIYLCGTDDGLIHRCSTIYNEKYLESYRGHTGPVYKVHWSPFEANIFLSASADWTVCLWMVGYEQPCMLFPSSNSKTVFDAIWSPKSSTVFCCVSEKTIEVWDLSESILDPIYIANCPEQLTLTSIAYATDSDCIFVGTSDGAVWIYHLENGSPSRNANDLLMIVEQNMRSQLDASDRANQHQGASLATTPSTSDDRD